MYEHMKTWGFVSKEGVGQLLGGLLAAPQVPGLQVSQECWLAWVSVASCCCARSDWNWAGTYYTVVPDGGPCSYYSRRSCSVRSWNPHRHMMRTQ